jgi:hypothetical protein
MVSAADIPQSASPGEFTWAPPRVRVIIEEAPEDEPAITEAPREIPSVQQLPADELDVRFRHVWHCFVDLWRQDGVRVWFRVNRRKDRVVSVIDYGKLGTGATGVTGTSGRLPAPHGYAGRRRWMTLSAFGDELARFVGAERAEQFIQSLLESR